MYYVEVLQKYAVFKGRASRKEFWMFVLINMIISLVLQMIDRQLSDSGMMVLSGLYSLAVLLPSLGVAVRRLHDTDRSGWWFLINLVPFVGVIVFIVLAAMKGTSGSNKYGPEPAKA